MKKFSRINKFVAVSTGPNDDGEYESRLIRTYYMSRNGAEPTKLKDYENVEVKYSDEVEAAEGHDKLVAWLEENENQVRQ